MIRKPSCVLVLAIVLVTMTSQAVQAVTTYIGDAAAQGMTFNAAGGPRADTVGVLTYISTAPGNMFTSAIARSITLTEVNFFADLGGTLRPFVARYNGGNNQLGSSYTVLVKGDPIIVTPAGVFGPDATDHLVNASFLVGGVNPVLNLNAGDVIAAGWLQNGNIVYISGLPGSGVADYISNGDALTAAAIGGSLTLNSSFPFDRTMQFNVGFIADVVPEPATLGLLTLGAAGLLLRRRRA